MGNMKNIDEYISYSNVHIHSPIYEYLSYIKYQSQSYFLFLYFFLVIIITWHIIYLFVFHPSALH